MRADFIHSFILRTLIFGSVLASLTVSTLVEAKTIAYGDLPRLVGEKNENVEAARLSLKAQEKRKGSLARSFLPSLSGQVGAETFRSGQSSVRNDNFWKAEASLNLYRGGRDALVEEVAKANVKAASARHDIDYQEELKEARMSYWGLVAVNKLIEAHEESFKKNEANLKSARRRAGAGLSTAADSVQFELYGSSVQQELKKLALERDLLKNRLSVALGLDEHESLEVQKEFPEVTKADALSVPELKTVAAQKSVELLDAQAEAERLNARKLSKWWAPRVDLYASYGQPPPSEIDGPTNRGESEFAAGVRMSVNLGEGFQESNEASARRLEARALERRKAHRAREVTAADHELRHDLKLLQELIVESERDLQKAERFSKLTSSEYDRGVKNGPDLLSAFEKYFEFRERRINLFKEYLETKVELESMLP